MTEPNGLGDLMRDPEQAAASITAHSDGLVSTADPHRAAQQRTEDIRLSATNSDASVRVTARAGGNVMDLAFSGRAPSMPVQELSAQILTTMQRAQAGIGCQVVTALAEETGNEDAQTRALMLDHVRDAGPSARAVHRSGWAGSGEREEQPVVGNDP